MTQLSIQVTGAELVRQGLQNLSKEIPNIGRLQIYRTSQAIVKRMKYPPPGELPTYSRTYKLYNGWKIIPKSNGYTIQNDVLYAKRVIGNAVGLEQAWMHARPGRWPLFRDVNDEEVAKLPPEMDKNISQVARSQGL